MPLPDKLPEAPKAPSTNPTEGGVSPAAQREGTVRAVDQQLVAVDTATRARVASRQDQVDQLAAAASTPTTTSTDSSKKGSGGWGALSGLSDLFTKMSDGFGDLGKKFSDWLKKVMGTKDKDPKDPEEGADPDEDEDTDSDNDYDTDTLAPPVNPEKSIEEHEMLTPLARVFTFAKSLGEAPPVTDVPRVRPVHPVTKKTNVPHEGVDIGTKYGTPFYATQEVTYVSTTNNGAAGLRLNGRLSDGTIVSFLHLSKVPKLKAGDRLPRGAWLGDTGNSGRGTGPHLHFEINYGESGDPIDYLDPGLVASADRKIQSKKEDNEWIPLEGLEHDHEHA